MKKVKLILVICVVAGMYSSCIKEKGKVIFKNRSVSNKTLIVVWDGSVITTLYPQMDSETFEVQPGSHTLVFKVANTNNMGCDKGTPSINEGYTHTFICSY